MLKKKAVLVLILSLVITTSITFANSLENIILPNSFVLAQIKIGEIVKTPIYKFLQDQKNNLPKTDNSDYEKYKKIFNECGVGDHEIKNILISVTPSSTLPLETSIIGNNDARLVFGAEFEKKISYEQIKKLVNKIAEIENAQVKISDSIMSSHKILLIQLPPEKNIKEKLALYISNNGKFLIGGDLTIINRSIEQIESTKLTEPSKEIAERQKEINKNDQAYVIVLIPKDVRTKMASNKQDSPAKDQGMTNPADYQAFGDMNAITAELRFDQNVNILLQGYFTMPKSAQAMQKMINRFLPLVKFQLFMMAQDNPLQVINTIKSTFQQNNPKVSLSFTLSQQDFTSFEAMSKKNNNQKRQQTTDKRLQTKKNAEAKSNMLSY